MGKKIITSLSKKRLRERKRRKNEKKGKEKGKGKKKGGKEGNRKKKEKDGFWLTQENKQLHLPNTKRSCQKEKKAL